jgi:hypothetical protein
VIFSASWWARRRRLSGEIMSGSPANSLTLRIRGLPVGYEKVGPVQQGELEELFEKAGELLLDQLAPSNLAFALYRREDYARALEVAGRAADNASLPRHERAQCEILRWLLLRRTAPVAEKTLEALRRAAAYDQTHPMVVMAVAEQMNDAARELGEKSEFWERMSVASSRWAWNLGGPNKMDVQKSRSAGLEMESRRADARSILERGRRALLAALKTRRQLHNALLNPLTSPLDINSMVAQLNWWLGKASTSLETARENDPEIIDAVPFAKLEARLPKLKAWRDEQADPRLSQGRVGAIEVSRIINDAQKDLKQLDKVSKERRRNLDVKLAKDDVIRAWKDAISCWPRRQPLKAGYQLAGLIKKLEQNRQDNERLAINMRLLPKSGQLMLRYAIRNNARLDAWIATRLSRSDDAKEALRKHFEGEALLDKWIAERSRGSGSSGPS